MKTYLTIAAILAGSLGITSMAAAHGGGGGFSGGGHFGGGGMHFGGGGMHFGGGGMHFSAPPAMGRFSSQGPVAHFSAPVSAAHSSTGARLFAPATVSHFSSPAARGRLVRETHGFVPSHREDRGRHDRNGDRHRRVFLGGAWPYYGDWDYGIPDYTTPSYDGSDSTVAAVQDALARQGYYRGPIDGTLDLTTQDAIAKYDGDHHLPVAYTVTQELLSALLLE